MPDETIVAVYDNAAHAEAAVQDLHSINVPPNAITRHSGGSFSGQPGQTEPGHMQSGYAEPGREKGFWSSLFGGDPGADETVYDRSVASGSSVVTVKVPDQHVQRVMDVLERHNPIDLDERAASYGTGMGNASTTTTTTATPLATPTAGASAATSPKTGEEVVALSEEQLTVGKRLINRGTTRIRRFVVETPVEETVNLHSEQVSIERRPVAPGTKASTADFTDRVVEVSETAEEAVVAKTAQVKEEVVINKTATDRVETVRDTVRREDVEITKEGQTARDDQITTDDQITKDEQLTKDGQITKDRQTTGKTGTSGTIPTRPDI